jgi:hypothetical protein
MIEPRRYGATRRKRREKAESGKRKRSVISSQSSEKEEKIIEPQRTQRKRGEEEKKKDKNGISVTGVLRDETKKQGRRGVGGGQSRADRQRFVLRPRGQGATCSPGCGKGLREGRICTGVSTEFVPEGED